MAATVQVDIEAPAATRRAGKPKRVIQGLRRRACIKFLRQAEVLQNQDQEEENRATRKRYTPTLILSERRFKTALATLRARVREMLATKA